MKLELNTFAFRVILTSMLLAVSMHLLGHLLGSLLFPVESWSRAELQERLQELIVEPDWTTALQLWGRNSLLLLVMTYGAFRYAKWQVRCSNNSSPTLANSLDRLFFRVLLPHWQDVTQDKRCMVVPLVMLVLPVTTVFSFSVFILGIGTPLIIRHMGIEGSPAFILTTAGIIPHGILELAAFSSAAIWSSAAIPFQMHDVLIEADFPTVVDRLQSRDLYNTSGAVALISVVVLAVAAFVEVFVTPRLIMVLL